MGKMEKEKAFLRKAMTEHGACPQGRDGREQQRPSSGEPPAGAVGVVDAATVAAEIPKIVHQKLVMTQFFSARSL